MSALDEWRRTQHDEFLYPSDHQLAAYLHEVPKEAVRLDLLPVSAVEIRHLSRINRRTA